METPSFINKWFHRLFKGASLATVAFAFQACYGMPRDFGMDQYIGGVVLDGDSVPVPDAVVYVDSTYQYAKTDQEGKFYFYIHVKEEYRIRVSGAEGDSIIYQDKDTIVKNEEVDLSSLVIVLNK